MPACLVSTSNGSILALHAVHLFTISKQLCLDNKDTALGVEREGKSKYNLGHQKPMLSQVLTSFPFAVLGE